MILAGDIGGTNSRLAIFDENLQKVQEKVFPNAGRAGPEEFIAQFRKDLDQKIDRACIAVAGFVREGKATFGNLNWELDERILASELGCPVTLVNDMIGHAEGIEVLPPGALITLQAGQPARGGARSILAAGTGLGEGGLVFDARSSRYVAFATETGHSDFSARNEEEDALARFLRARLGRVYWDAILSGRGLRHLYDFYCESDRFSKQDELPKKFEGGPTPAEISAAGLAGDSPIAVAALDLFVRLYGAEAGNAALRMLATGGVYLSGAIAIKIIGKLQSDNFLTAFRRKGTDKYQALMAQIPVHVVTFELCGLYGAANYARKM
jgi:glucokinase